MNTQELDELYRETIIAHARRPHNFGTLLDADAAGDGKNPICGDEVSVQVALDGDRIRSARFQGKGCAISQASASMLTDAVTDRTLVELDVLVAGIERMLRGEGEPDADLGELAALRGVAQFPTRVKCALLAWKVLRQALANRDGAPSLKAPQAPDRPGA